MGVAVRAVVTWYSRPWSPGFDQPWLLDDAVASGQLARVGLLPSGSLVPLVQLGSRQTKTSAEIDRPYKTAELSPDPIGEKSRRKTTLLPPHQETGLHAPAADRQPEGEGRWVAGVAMEYFALSQDQRDPRLRH